MKNFYVKKRDQIIFHSVFHSVFHFGFPRHFPVKFPTWILTVFLLFFLRMNSDHITWLQGEDAIQPIIHG